MRFETILKAISISSVCALVGCVFKLAMGRDDCWLAVILALSPAYVASGMAEEIYKRDEKRGIKAPWQRVFITMFVISVFCAIYAVFIAGVVFNLEWKSYILSTILVTGVTYIMNYQLLKLI